MFFDVLSEHGLSLLRTCRIRTFILIYLKWSQGYILYFLVSAGKGFYDLKPWREGLKVALKYDVAYN